MIMLRRELIRPVLLFLAAAFVAGCTCTPPPQPPQTMATGLIGYVTQCKFIPYLQKQGVKDVKCALGKIRLQDCQYRFGESIHAMSEDLFETLVWDSGQQVAAKEAINAILSSTGIGDSSRLWEPDVLAQFKDAIKQNGGRSVVDYLLLVNITGVTPSLQAQAKIVCTTPGPDWGQQIPVRVEINWKSIWCSLEGEHTGKEWQHAMEDELGCQTYSAKTAAPATDGGGGTSAVAPAPPPKITITAPKGQDLMDDLKNNFIPQLMGLNGDIALFPPLWESDQGEWLAKGLSEDITKGLSSLLRPKAIAGFDGAKLVSALESGGNRSFCHLARPEDAAGLGFRLPNIKGVVCGELSLVKPTAFMTKVGVKLWCLDTFGDEKASFDFIYDAGANVSGQSILRRFEFAATRGIGGRATPFEINLDREIAWAADDMLGAMIGQGLLKEDPQMIPHLSGYLKVSQKGITLSQDRLIAVVGATAFTSQGQQQLNPAPQLVTWMTNRLSLLDLRYSTLLDAEIAGFIRAHVNLFQDAPDRIDQASLQKLVGQGKPVPDTMVLVKVRPPLVKGKGQTLSICWRDVASGNVIAWYEYALPSFPTPQPPMGSQTFLNTPLQGSNFVFVIDTSGSMGAQLASKTITRMEYTKDELIRLIDSLNPNTAFQILAFSDAVLPWQSQGLAQASPQAQSMARQFVQNLQSQGSTSARKALLHALHTPGVQTICFLSDGQPDSGTTTVLNAVKQVNAQGVIINTFAFDDADLQFMGQLAADNGGVFTRI